MKSVISVAPIANMNWNTSNNKLTLAMGAIFFNNEEYAGQVQLNIKEGKVQVTYGIGKKRDELNKSLNGNGHP